MDEHRKDETERKLPPPPRHDDERRPWTREDFIRDLRRATRRAKEDQAA
jgi:hypothetical protein